jgi:hypothetical protein
MTRYDNALSGDSFAFIVLHCIVLYRITWCFTGLGGKSSLTVRFASNVPQQHHSHTDGIVMTSLLPLPPYSLAPAGHSTALTTHEGMNNAVCAYVHESINMTIIWLYVRYEHGHHTAVCAYLHMGDQRTTNAWCLSIIIWRIPPLGLGRVSDAYMHRVCAFGAIASFLCMTL